MKQAIRRLVALATLFTAVSTQALPIVEADAFTAGDHKAVRDTVSGLTWLDFGITNNKSYSQVVNELSTTYLGWHLPTESEVKTLWVNLFSTLPTWNPNIYGQGWGRIEDMNYKTNIPEIVAIFGINFTENFGYGNHNYSLGWFNGDDGYLKSSLLDYWEGDFTYSSASLYRAGADFSPFKDFVTAKYSTLLVKSSTVPEPSSLMLIGLGLLGLGFSRRRVTKS